MLFKTYDRSTGFGDCTIWEVACATSAATTFFKSIKCGRDGIEFIDAGFGCNNPCEILIEEAHRQFPGAQQMRVLSIGAGLGDVVTIKDKRLPILSALKKMATSSKNVAERLDAKYGDDGPYFRFNVSKGLEDITLSDWEKDSKISGHTFIYIHESQQQRAIKRCVDCLVATPAGEGPLVATPAVDEPLVATTAVEEPLVASSQAVAGGLLPVCESENILATGLH